MSWSRRSFLKKASVALGAAALNACTDAIDAQDPPDELPDSSDMADAPDMAGMEDMGPMLPSDLPDYVWEGEPGPEDLFSHGVASGDPTSDAIILWTRVTPDSMLDEVEVFWEIALDPDFEQRLGADTTTTSPDRDYTVKIDAANLWPGQTYYYRFWSQGRMSAIGRTRTAPDQAPEGLRFAVVSCSNYAAGFFHVYKQIAARADIDAVLHLGDYIYEYANPSVFYETSDGGRVNRGHRPPVEITTLADYRTRYAQYRTDPDLQEVHRQHPFVAVWDDHEIANNSWEDGAQNHNQGEGSWPDRRWEARKAYFEWLPIREQEERFQIWRSLSFGGLADLIMLDTRHWRRQKPVNSKGAAQDEDLVLLGDDQERWLIAQLESSQAQWKIIGQQVMFGQATASGNPVNFDQWDGYDATRRRILGTLRDNQIDDVVVLTGDIHTSWAHDLCTDPKDEEVYDPETGEGSLAVEFVTPAVTSSGFAALPDNLARFLERSNPNIKYYELSRRGYIILDLDASRAQADWYHVSAVDTPDFEESFSAGYVTQSGQNRLSPAEAPAPERDAAPLAPST